MLHKLIILLPLAVISANIFPSGYNLVNHTICITKTTDLTLEDERLFLLNSKCPLRTYHIGKQRVSWFEAFVLCQQYNMELASVESVEEEMAIEEHLKLEADGSGFWISATRLGTCNMYVFFTSGKPVIYNKFAIGQPDNAGNREECLEIYKKSNTDIYWYDMPCNMPEYKMNFICQSKSNCN